MAADGPQRQLHANPAVRRIARTRMESVTMAVRIAIVLFAVVVLALTVGLALINGMLSLSGA